MSQLNNSLLPMMRGDVIKVNLIKGKNLVASDVGGTSDPYIIIKSVLADGVELLEKPIRSRIIMKTLNPEWNETVSLPALKNFTSRVEILFVVMDFDRLTKDDFLGECKYVIDNSIYLKRETILSLEKIESGRIILSIDLERSEANKRYDIERKTIIRNQATNSHFKIHTCDQLLHFECPNYFQFNKESSTSESYLLESENNEQLKVSILPTPLHSTFEKSKRSFIGLSLIGFSKEFNFLREDLLTNISHSYGMAFRHPNRIEQIERVFFQFEKDGSQYCGHAYVLKLKEVSTSFASIVYCEKCNNTCEIPSISLKGEVLLNFIMNMLELRNVS